MSYNTINACAQDVAFYGRLTAAAAAEGSDLPDATASRLRWTVSAASDIEAAYASALAADNPNPGGDEAVITDQMILSAVQANWPEDT
jgi:hypothetical protein